MLLDATGKEIMIGQKYGYYTNKNGFTRTIIGEAKSTNKGKVLLVNCDEKEYMYNDGIKPPYKQRTLEKGISIFANIIFPVN